MKFEENLRWWVDFSNFFGSFHIRDPGTNNFVHHTKGINGLVVLTAKKFVEKKSDKKKVITFTSTVIACEAHNVHFHFLFTENF